MINYIHTQGNTPLHEACHEYNETEDANERDEYYDVIVALVNAGGWRIHEE